MTGHSCARLPTPDHCGHLGCRVGEASNPGVEIRQTRRAGTIIGDDEPLVQPCVQDTAQDRVRVRRWRGQLRALPWSWEDVAEIFCHTSGRIFERRVSSPPQQWEGRGAQDRFATCPPQSLQVQVLSWWLDCCEKSVQLSVRQIQSSPLAVFHQSSTGSLSLRE